MKTNREKRMAKTAKATVNRCNQKVGKKRVMKCACGTEVVVLNPDVVKVTCNVCMSNKLGLPRKAKDVKNPAKEKVVSKKKVAPKVKSKYPRSYLGDTMIAAVKEHGVDAGDKLLAAYKTACVEMGKEKTDKQYVTNCKAMIANLKKRGKI
jgi:hypothetical protein